MSKLSFRARALDPSKPLPIYLSEELPDLPEYSAINRAVPQMPSGMEKEEESEHHLQRAICAGLIIPTPEVFETEQEFYDRNYPPDYKMPKQYIHMQPLNLEQDIPDYDMDSADETWVCSQTRRLDLDPFKFEQMMDRLEKSSGQTVVTLNEAKALLKQDDELSIAVYDYWLNKRLKTQHPLILSVKTENRAGAAPNNPYLAFRRRTEKMQTRKNRKNDESSYEKMLKLRRDLSRAVTILEMIKRREKSKREQTHLSLEIFEKRYQARDFSGQLFSEFTSNVAKNSRPAFAPLYTNQYSHSPLSGGTTTPNQYSTGHHYNSSQYINSGPTKRDLDVLPGSSGVASSSSSRKEKRQYKKRKHKSSRDHKQACSTSSSSYHHQQQNSPGPPLDNVMSSEDEDISSNLPGSEGEDEGVYSFRRNKNCQYHKPTSTFGNWPWTSKEENGLADPKYRFTLTSLRHPRPRCIGFARRRMGRGGRVILDRMSTNMDDLWSNMDYKIFDSEKKISIEMINDEEMVVDNSSVVSDKTTTTISEPIIINRFGEQRTINNLNNKIISGNNVIINKLEQLETTIIPTTTIKSSVDNLIIKQEKLDDYDKYLVGGSITNVYNKNSVLTTNQLSDLSNISISSCGGSIPKLLSQDSGISLSQKIEFPAETTDSTILQPNLLTSIKTEPFDTNSRDGTEIDAEIISDEKDFDFLDDIRKNWLHFRPKTPTTPELVDFYKFGEDTNQLMESTPFSIEIQSLNNQLPSSVFTENSDNLFLTNQFSLDDLIDDPIQPSINEISLNDFNSSGDSLNELNLSIGDSNEDSEKMLDNILQECQIEDLKSFHTNTNFWNGILEDTLEDIIDEKKNVFDKLGYSSEFVSNFDDKRCPTTTTTTTTTGINNNGEKRGEKRKRNSQRCNQRTGSSMFNLTNSVIKDDFFKKDDVKVTTETPIKNTGGVMIGNSTVLSGISEQKVFIKTEPTENYSISNNYVLQSPLIMTQNPLLEKVSTENTIVLTSTPATTPIRRHINGPTDKNTIQHLLKQANLINRKLPVHKPIGGSSEAEEENKRNECYVKVSIPEYSVVTTNNTNIGQLVSTSNTNHNFTLSHNVLSSQPITVLSNQPNQQNKIIINSGTSSHHHHQQTTLNATNIQEFLAASGQNSTTKIQLNQIQNSNIKVNLLPSTNNLTGVDGKTTIVSSPQQRVKLDKNIGIGIYDSDKNRILYNVKNSRGTQFLAQIQNPKVVNILPIQHGKNLNSVVQNVQTVVGQTNSVQGHATVLSKGQTIQRISNNSPNVRQIQLQQQQLQQQQQQQQIVQQPTQQIHHIQHIQQVGGDLSKIVQNNDSTVTGININTTNR